jgi:hypothetical protein
VKEPFANSGAGDLIPKLSYKRELTPGGGSVVGLTSQSTTIKKRHDKQTMDIAVRAFDLRS